MRNGKKNPGLSPNSLIINLIKFVVPHNILWQGAWMNSWKYSDSILASHALLVLSNMTFWLWSMVLPTGCLLVYAFVLLDIPDFLHVSLRLLLSQVSQALYRPYERMLDNGLSTNMKNVMLWRLYDIWLICLHLCLCWRWFIYDDMILSFVRDAKTHCPLDTIHRLWKMCMPFSKASFWRHNHYIKVVQRLLFFAIFVLHIFVQGMQHLCGYETDDYGNFC